jgi:hypothetical protein
LVWSKDCIVLRNRSVSGLRGQRLPARRVPVAACCDFATLAIGVSGFAYAAAKRRNFSPEATRSGDFCPFVKRGIHRLFMFDR